jgi:hypothetical protein
MNKSYNKKKSSKSSRNYNQVFSSGYDANSTADEAGKFVNLDSRGSPFKISENARSRYGH